MLVQIAVNGLGRHEHQRRVLRLARNEILFGDIVDMAAYSFAG